MGQTKEVNLFYQTKEELKILKTLGWVKIRNLSSNHNNSILARQLMVKIYICNMLQQINR